MFGRVRGELGRVAAGFDPALIPGRFAARMLDDVVAIKNSAANLETMLAARVAETGGLDHTDARHSAEALARRTGGTVKDAKKKLSRSCATRVPGSRPGSSISKPAAGGSTTNATFVTGSTVRVAGSCT